MFRLSDHPDDKGIESKKVIQGIDAIDASGEYGSPKNHLEALVKAAAESGYGVILREVSRFAKYFLALGCPTKPYSVKNKSLQVGPGAGLIGINHIRVNNAASLKDQMSHHHKGLTKAMAEDPGLAKMNLVLDRDRLDELCKFQTKKGANVLNQDDKDENNIHLTWEDEGGNKKEAFAKKNENGTYDILEKNGEPFQVLGRKMPNGKTLPITSDYDIFAIITPFGVIDFNFFDKIAHRLQGRKIEATRESITIDSRETPGKGNISPRLLEFLSVLNNFVAIKDEKRGREKKKSPKIRHMIGKKYLETDKKLDIRLMHMDEKPTIEELDKKEQAIPTLIRCGDKYYLYGISEDKPKLTELNKDIPALQKFDFLSEEIVTLKNDDLLFKNIVEKNAHHVYTKEKYDSVKVYTQKQLDIHLLSVDKEPTVEALNKNSEKIPTLIEYGDQYYLYGLQDKKPIITVLNSDLVKAHPFDFLSKALVTVDDQDPLFKDIFEKKAHDVFDEVEIFDREILEFLELFHHNQELFNPYADSLEKNIPLLFIFPKIGKESEKVFLAKDLSAVTYARDYLMDHGFYFPTHETYKKDFKTFIERNKSHVSRKEIEMVLNRQFKKIEVEKKPLGLDRYVIALNKKLEDIHKTTNEFSRSLHLRGLKILLEDMIDICADPTKRVRLSEVQFKLLPEILSNFSKDIQKEYKENTLCRQILFSIKDLNEIITGEVNEEKNDDLRPPALSVEDDLPSLITSEEEDLLIQKLETCFKECETIRREEEKAQFTSKEHKRNIYIKRFEEIQDSLDTYPDLNDQFAGKKQIVLKQLQNWGVNPYTLEFNYKKRESKADISRAISGLIDAQKRKGKKKDLVESILHLDMLCDKKNEISKKDFEKAMHKFIELKNKFLEKLKEPGKENYLEKETQYYLFLKEQKYRQFGKTLDSTKTHRRNITGSLGRVFSSISISPRTPKQSELESPKTPVTSPKKGKHERTWTALFSKQKESTSSPSSTSSRSPKSPSSPYYSTIHSPKLKKSGK